MVGTWRVQLSPGFVEPVLGTYHGENPRKHAVQSVQGLRLCLFVWMFE